MKKKILVLTLFLIGLVANANTATLSLHSVTPSTISAGFEVQFLASSLAAGTCYGDFTVAFQRKLSSSQTWSNVTMTPVTGTSTTTITAFSKLYKIYQLEGLTYNYRVTITFNPQTGGTGCNTAPNQSKVSNTINVATPKACFNIINTSTPINTASYFGNQIVNKIGLSTDDVKINASCSVNAIGHHVRVAKFDLANWEVIDDLYNDWISSSINPSNINLNTLIAQNGKNFEPFKVYLVGLSVGPFWHSAPAKFITIDFAGRATFTDQLKNDNAETNKISVSPNPVINNLTIDFSVTKVSKINIYDLLGKQVYTYNPISSESNLEINFSDYVSGTYLLQMETENGIETKKIIKQ